jgi:hypothetical protein
MKPGHTRYFESMYVQYYYATGTSTANRFPLHNAPVKHATVDIFVYMYKSTGSMIIRLRKDRRFQFSAVPVTFCPMGLQYSSICTDPLRLLADAGQRNIF